MFWYLNDQESKEIPDVDELVMATIISFNESGFTVSLNEYNDQKAFMVITNVLRKKTRKNIQTICPVGSQHVLIVTATDMDRDGGYLIDVSKKAVDPSDEKKMKEWYNKTHRIVGIARRFSYVSDFTQEKWMADVFSPNLYKDFTEEHLLDTLSMRENISDLEIDECYKKLLKTHHRKMFGVHIAKVKQDVRLVSFQIEGNEEMKKLLQPLEVGGDYTDEELYENDQVKTTIRPTAIHVYEITAYAGTINTAKNKCEEISQCLLDYGKSNGFAQIVN